MAVCSACAAPILPCGDRMPQVRDHFPRVQGTDFHRGVARDRHLPALGMESQLRTAPTLGKLPRWLLGSQVIQADRAIRTADGALPAVRTEVEAIGIVEMFHPNRIAPAQFPEVKTVARPDGQEPAVAAEQRPGLGA